MVKALPEEVEQEYCFTPECDGKVAEPGDRCQACETEYREAYAEYVRRPEPEETCSTEDCEGADLNEDLLCSSCVYEKYADAADMARKRERGE